MEGLKSGYSKRSVTMKNLDTWLAVLAGIGLSMINPLAGSAQDGRPSSSIRKVEAPALGITASSIILTWDDDFEPNYQSSDSGSWSGKYFIYENGVKVGSTPKRTFTIKGLSAGKTYTFSVTSREDPAGLVTADQSIRVITKTGGKIDNVRKFGAKGDGINGDGPAIQKAINTCSKDGIVLVPAGRYLVDHLELKSSMTLELAKDAVLLFMGYDEKLHYPVTKAILPGPDGDINYESCSFITGLNVHNVVITGEGTIDGNGATWWPHYKEISRPYTVEFILSSNILVQGITIQDPPVWNNHLLYVDDAIYSDVKFLKVSKASGVNGDGLDPDASRHILIVGSLFGNQDDCIAIKSGKYGSDGNKRRRSSEYITIRDCVFDGNAAPGAGPLGIAIGSECSGGIRHVLIQNCTFIDVASLANIKANRQRPFACIEDIRMKNITYTNNKAVDRWWNRAPISVDLFYGAPEDSNPSHPEPLSSQTPVFRDIHFDNISIYNPVGRGIYISGLAESPVHDISFNRVYVTSLNGVTVQNVDTLSLVGITVRPIVKPGK